MSFTKTISTIAALSSIFGVSIAGYKLAENSANTPPSPLEETSPSPLEEKIIQLERQLEEVKTQKPVVEAQPAPAPAPEPAILPPPPPPVTTTETTP